MSAVIMATKGIISDTFCPAEEDVEYGVDYGDGNAEFTGALSITSATDPSLWSNAVELDLDVSERILNN